LVREHLLPPFPPSDYPPQLACPLRKCLLRSLHFDQLTRGIVRVDTRHGGARVDRYARPFVPIAAPIEMSSPHRAGGG
jgi:hypothetical protein